MKASTILIVVLLLFTYQNCGKTVPGSFGNTPAVTSGTLAVSSTAIGFSKVDSLKFSMDAQQTFQKSGQTFYINGQRKFSLDNSSGVISEVDDQGQALQKYCLDNEMKSEINELLGSAQICHNEPQLPADVVCSQVIVKGYAQIEVDGSMVDLGSASDTCGRNAIDLCGEQSAQLQSWLTVVTQNLENYKCQ